MDLTLDLTCICLQFSGSALAVLDSDRKKKKNP